MLLTESQGQHMPVAIFVLDKVAVTYSLNDERSLVAVGENRILRVALEFSPDGISAGAGYHVAVLCAALRSHEVVNSIYLVEMRAFKVASAGALPDAAACGELLSGGYVDFALNHSPDAVIIGAVAHEVGAAVLKEQRRIDTALIDVYRLRPLAVDIVGVNVEILVGGVVGSHHVESAVAAADSRRENSAGAVDLIEHYLAGSGEHIAYLLPVNEV